MANVNVESPQTPLVHIRLAVPDDVPAIVVIEHLSFVHAGERFGRRRIKYLIHNPRAVVLVAEQDEKVLAWTAGFAWMRGKEPWGRVYALAVDPVARGRRLGEQLLNQMIRTLRAQGARPIFLEVNPDNHIAVRLYERNGFAACRALPNYYGPDRPAARMVQSL
jgi:ribosomal protein S18 acetylase RimI-like enzyme